MAAANKPISAFSRRNLNGAQQQQNKVQAFTQQVYRQTGGATSALKDVYSAYLANQRKIKDKA